MTTTPHALAGVFSALITPFKADGALNLATLAPLAELQLAQGIHGFYVGGSTGEAFLQAAEERKAVLREFARAVNGRAKLIAHVGAIATDEAIAIAHAAADAGYNAVSAIPPFYYDFAPTEVRAHYHALADATPLPVRSCHGKGRRHGPRQDRRWARAWSPQQIACRLRLDVPGDETMRISHEAIHQALHVQGRGAVRAAS